MRWAAIFVMLACSLPARAAVVDPETSALERIANGDWDLEDAQVAWGHTRMPRAWLSLEALTAQGGVTTWAGAISLGVCLECLILPRTALVSPVAPVPPVSPVAPLSPVSPLPALSPLSRHSQVWADAANARGPDRPRFPVTPHVARAAVQAAWRTVGMSPDDARVESLISRARSSALLPETRLRAMRLVNERSSANLITEDVRTYDSAGQNLTFEARLTWRLDRLLFADDEITLERVRLDRHDARSKLAHRVLEALFHWQRAWLAAESSDRGSQEEMEATIRMVEAEATLDVLTGGWFSPWRQRLPRPR